MSLSTSDSAIKASAKNVEYAGVDALGLNCFPVAGSKFVAKAKSTPSYQNDTLIQ